MNIRNRLYRYEIWIAFLLLFTPLILILFDGGTIRSSISNYAYMEHNQIYYFLIFLAASMFANNGAIWIKNYNIFLGITLAGVGLTPHLEYSTIHLIFAALFFLGSVTVMIMFSSKKQLPVKILTGTVTTLGLLFHFIFGWYNLFFAEWIGILPICIHYIGESKGVLD